ncbi:flavodoxin family protein [Methanolapillus millepedarum]|uniref:NADPH-dependent FMN reductase-like domain-containing protein n=1 Tax=Methanolapillus millepedarum TaxID=3028296 RepID=A0AA96VBE4_9EURY|nr:hypothetical protein MsAc7_05590 [Methanosarcinaceae archaeon Ac7]
MKIIGLTASPRAAGNTVTLVTKMLEDAASKGAETKQMDLAKLDIKPCKGCNYCKSHEDCVQKDDFAKVISEMKSADGIILGSPVYFFDITAQEKTFVDRLYSCVDAQFKSRIPSGKKIAFIYSQNTPNRAAFEQNLAKYDQVAGMLGFQNVGKFVSVGDVKANPVEIEGAVALEKKLFDTL